MTGSAQRFPTTTWRCPLCTPHLGESGSVYARRREANQAVERYQAGTASPDADRLAHDLYRRHLPLVRKVLVRFCPESQCRPGACLVEELAGETYLIFRQALEEYDPSRGVDFLGYVYHRLDWGLRQRARALRKAIAAMSETNAEQPDRGADEEARLFDRLELEELFQSLRAEDVDLLTRRYADGYSGRELAEAMGVSYAAARKRLQRARASARRRGV